MTQVDYRKWLGDTFGVCKYETGTPDDKLEKLARDCKDYCEKKQLVSLVGSTEDTDLKDRLVKSNSDYPFIETGVKDDSINDLLVYQSAKKELESIFIAAEAKLQSLNDKFRVQNSELKPAKLFALNVVKANEEQDASPSILVAANSILSSMESADEYRRANDFEQAFRCLNRAHQLYEDQKTEIENARKDAVEQTQQAAESEQKAFELYAGDSHKMRDMVGDPDLMQLMTGVAFEGSSGSVKSQTLLAMERAFLGALERYDKLKKSGLSPIDAAETAFANIPRSFWPDRAIREIDMFLRIEMQIELDEAQQESNALSEVLERSSGVQELGELGVSTTTDTMESVLKMKLGLKTNEELPGINSEEFKKLAPDQQSLLKLQNDFGSAGKAVGGFGVFLKAATAISKTVEMRDGFEGPVQKKIAEFERNAAWFDVAMKAKDWGADLLKDVCPALGIASSAVEMAASMYLAAKYFKQLHDIQKLGEKAKRDPKSVVYLPLIRMDKHERLKAAEQVMSFIQNALAVAGKSAQLSGIGAGAGLGIDVAGKIVAQGSKFVFANIKWSDAKTAQKVLLKAKGPPIDRESVAEVFKYSNKYATYCLAIAAIEDNDPWAIRYCTTSGLNEGEVADPATSVQVLRKYILVQAKMEDTQETFKESVSNSTLIKPFLFVAEKIKRKPVPFEPIDMLDNETGMRLPNPKYKPMTSPVGLSRASWQTAKKEAIALGWYEDGTGVGDMLDRYDLAKKEWESAKLSNPNFLTSPTEADVAAAEIYHSEVKALNGLLSSMRPLASDQVSTHDAMQKYQIAMQRMLQDDAMEFTVARSVMLEKYYSEGKGRDEVDEAKKKLQEASENRTKEFDLELLRLLNESTWDSPFGETKLDQFEDLVCNKLGISPAIIDGRIKANIDNELKKRLLVEARDNLGAYTKEELAKPFKTVFKNLLKNLAYDVFLLLGSQARDLRDESLGSKVTLTPISTIPELKKVTWLAAVQEGRSFLKEWKGNAGGAALVSVALSLYESEKLRFEKSGVAAYAANAEDGLRQVQEQLETLQPVDADGLPYEPMVQFIDKMFRLIPNELERLQKAADEKLYSYTLSSPATLKSDWWENEKKTLVEKHLLKDASTGIGKALKNLETMQGRYKQLPSTPASVELDQARTAFANSLSALGKVLQKYQPLTKGKKSHPGGILVKTELIKKLEEAHLAISSSLYATIKIQLPTVVSEKDWAAAKKEFIQYGLVDEKTGIGAAIKAYDSAKSKWIKGQKAPKLKEPLEQAAIQLMDAARNANPRNSWEKPFDPAAKYLAALIELVVNEINAP